MQRHFEAASSTCTAEMLMGAFRALPLSANPSASKITLVNLVGSSEQKAPQIISKRHRYQLELMHFVQAGV